MLGQYGAKKFLTDLIIVAEAKIILSTILVQMRSFLSSRIINNILLYFCLFGLFMMPKRLQKNYSWKLTREWQRRKQIKRLLLQDCPL